MRVKIEDCTRMQTLGSIADGTVIRSLKDGGLYLVGSQPKHTTVPSRNVIRLSDGKTRWLSVDLVCAAVSATLTVA
jgi:hypothetical protein